ncbi:hypothetical protein D9M70_97340 [compost metagenome]
MRGHDKAGLARPFVFLSAKDRPHHCGSRPRRDPAGRQRGRSDSIPARAALLVGWRRYRHWRFRRWRWMLDRRQVRRNARGRRLLDRRHCMGRPVAGLGKRRQEGAHGASPRWRSAFIEANPPPECHQHAHAPHKDSGGLPAHEEERGAYRDQHVAEDAVLPAHRARIAALPLHARGQHGEIARCPHYAYAACIDVLVFEVPVDIERLGSPNSFEMKRSNSSAFRVGHGFRRRDGL